MMIHTPVKKSNTIRRTGCQDLKICRACLDHGKKLSIVFPHGLLYELTCALSLLRESCCATALNPGKGIKPTALFAKDIWAENLRYNIERIYGQLVKELTPDFDRNNPEHIGALRALKGIGRVVPEVAGLKVKDMIIA